MTIIWFNNSISKCKKTGSPILYYVPSLYYFHNSVQQDFSY